MNLKPQPRTALRLGAAATAMTLAAVVASPSPAGAAPAGHGMAKVETTILDARLANLLGVKVLNDVGTSVTNPLNGEVGGVANLTQLQLTSGVVGALNKTIGQKTAKSPGGVPEVKTQVLDLSAVGQIVPGVSALTGKIQEVTLKAAHVPTSSTSQDASIVDAGLAGGLATVHALTSSDKTGSGTAAAEAVRHVGVDALTVLKLDDLLKLIGLDLLTMPLDVLAGVAAALGVPIQLPQGQTSLSEYVAGLVDSLDTVADVVDSTTVAPVFDVLNPLLTSVGVGGIVPETPVATAVDILQNVLKPLIQTVLSFLNDAALVKVNALNIDTRAKATDALSTSVADATGTLGGITVGAITVPGVDIVALASQVNNLLAGVFNALGLPKLVDLRLFDKNTSVQNVDGVIKAVSSITGLHLSVNLPQAVVGLINGLTAPINAGTTLGLVTDGLLGSNGNAMSSLIPESGEVLGLDVVKIQSNAEHAIPAGPTAKPVNVPPGQKTPTSLPKTGGDSLPFGLAAAGMTAAAVAASRARRRSRDNTNTTA